MFFAARFMIFAIVATGAAGCGTLGVYRSPETTVRVVDSDTREPIENAIVVFGWASAGGHGQHYGYVHLEESISDDSDWAEVVSELDTRLRR